MNNPNTMLIIEIPLPISGLAHFTLKKGAQLDASIINPKKLIEMHQGIHEDTTIEDKIESQILKSVMGECSKDIMGKCTKDEAIELIRALNHKQEVKVEVIFVPNHDD